MLITHHIMLLTHHIMLITLHIMLLTHHIIVITCHVLLSAKCYKYLLTQCTVNNGHDRLYHLHCNLYILHTRYVTLTVFTELHYVHSVQCILHTVHCTLSNNIQLLCILFTVYNIINVIHYTGCVIVSYMTKW